MKLDIHEDIRRAHTPTADLYHRPAWWALQRERLFPRTWHVLPDPDRPAERGRVQPCTLLEGCLDEPLLLSRTDELRCLSNVCTHRGAVLVEEAAQLEGIRCRYHGRKFELDGRFHSMPEFEEAEDFPSPKDDLPQVALESWGPLHFVSLAPAHPLSALLDPVRERVGWLPVDELQLGDTRTYEFDANWALYCDNYLEGFHVPFVHPTLAKAIDYRQYRTELRPHGVLQVGIAADDEPSFELPKSHPDHGERVAGYYYWLLPTTMLNFYPWGLSLNVVLPAGPTRTRVVFQSWVHDASKRAEGAGSGLDAVEMEDEEVVLSVQRGVRSLLYERGRYSPAREKGVHHFHRLLAEMLDTA